MEKSLERIDVALGAMASVGPRPLRAYLEKPGPDFDAAGPEEIDWMLNRLVSKDPNDPARLRFSTLLRSWDNAKDTNWIDNTSRNTAARRKVIHRLLKSDTHLEERINELLPFYHLEEPLIIAESHQDWYSPKDGIRDYYWRKYLQYLRERRQWEEVSILSIDNSTRAIVECLANPESSQAYASRGLVMGYVQSGKTANFAGVVARAADAGYRLIVVLAGTWNILRNQTQRRFDKELLGKELLQDDDTYLPNAPRDWDEFLEHGADPVELGHFRWQRLTRPDLDFRGLKAAINALEFEKINKAAPLYDSSNLHALPVKLLVVKKHAGIISKLVKDLETLQRTRLAELPALVIDDESDQAGLNIIDPHKAESRSPTNLSIVRLLRLFPRGQYVGYTATPYANALVNPDDPEDLYPRDFIISLERPEGYMGVSDFFDPTTAFEDLQRHDWSQPEIAYVRRVENPVGADDEDLKKALRSHVLAGGVKLYRNASDPRRYKPEYFRHHTMLVHTSLHRGPQAALAERLNELWASCAFNSPRGLRDLEELWNDDHSKVCRAIGGQLTPSSFRELVPHLSEAIKRIERGDRIVLVVNSDSPQAPDFSAAPVWKIIVGGNKLSRGYTIEGLTVSYYRRVAGAADTLMQMGRWFGFRPGYQDLVRVFLGVKEGKRGETDLVADFKGVCRMEERFREEIKRYLRKADKDRITPKDIPPLISVCGSLPPVSRVRMFNAVLVTKNFGGQRSMLTLAPSKAPAMDKNVKTLEGLLAASKSLGRIILGGESTEKKTLRADAVVLETTNEELIAFLKGYRWLETDYKDRERPTDTNLQIEFLEKEKHEIASWLILAPQRKISFGKALKVGRIGELSVKERHRIEDRGFQVFGEPDHRTIADFLAGIATGKAILAKPNKETKSLQHEHRGVLLLYPVREKESSMISIGFELFFPENKIPRELGFRVRRNTGAIVVDVSESD